MEESSEKALTDEEILTQIGAAGAQEKVGPLDPDFLLIFSFAILMDGLDIALLVLKVLTAFTIGEVFSKVLDIFTFIIIGGWIHWRVGKITKSKKVRQKKLQKFITKRRVVLKQQLAKGIKRPFLRALIRAGLALGGELITLVGLLPFWTISVLLTLKEE